ncbi:uncharacterized protein LACBIDRAFT_302167 [Laccaria bicolor S238N-H82]|uniref:Predicted protein n=1 Tax=Laccaria bicolor (strain S238N-H82 / ATCC MYA-4686) TaxID=486041 RepID=B0DH82_LACBS|nr:uncharacterized protein LACBIDRAFT_302167 [Laccaria bicolor S238N-H82]EDR06063.1 predicted protein [Laccaria bicolor S238N-H82]|eukprot:XP_001883351.1 predicted protein [Laccaria bicolor S238N-H82]
MVLCVDEFQDKANLFHNDDYMHPAQRSQPVIVFGRMWHVFGLLFPTLSSAMSPLIFFKDGSTESSSSTSTIYTYLGYGPITGEESAPKRWLRNLGIGFCTQRHATWLFIYDPLLCEPSQNIAVKNPHHNWGIRTQNFRQCSGSKKGSKRQKTGPVNTRQIEVTQVDVALTFWSNVGDSWGAKATDGNPVAFNLAEGQHVKAGALRRFLFWRPKMTKIAQKDHFLEALQTGVVLTEKYKCPIGLIYYPPFSISTPENTQQQAYINKNGNQYPHFGGNAQWGPHQVQPQLPSFHNGFISSGLNGMQQCPVPSLGYTQDIQYGFPAHSMDIQSFLMVISFGVRYTTRVHDVDKNTQINLKHTLNM